MAGILLCLPSLLQLTGRSEQFSSTLLSYLICLTPTFFVEAIYLPLSTMLVVQNLSVPILYHNVAACTVHLAMNFVLVRRCHLGLVGAAAATLAAYMTTVLLLGGYVVVSGQGPKVFGCSPSWAAVVAMCPFVRIGYSSTATHTIELLSYTMLVALVGFLPNADV